MEVLVTTSGKDAISKRFSKLASNAGNATEVFAEITAVLAESNEASWGRGVKLAESTQEQHDRDGTEPLVKSGALKHSLTSKSGSGAAVRIISPHEMVFGTTIFYAKWIQYGFTHTGGEQVPKRRVMKFTAKSRLFIRRQLQEHLTKGVTHHL